MLVYIVGFGGFMTSKSLLLSNEIPNKLTIVGNINQKILQKFFSKCKLI